MKNSRDLALEVLEEVFNKKAYSNIILRRKLNDSNLNSQDKALTTEIVYGVIKYKSSIDKILQYYINRNFNTIDSKILNILRIAVYQVQFLDKIPEFAAVNEAVEQAKRVSINSSKFVNGVLRNFLRTKDNVKYYNKDNYLEKLKFLYSFPDWIINMFIKQYGKDKVETILKGLNSVPSITVRINALKTDYDEIWQKLKENHYEIEEGKVSPEAIRIIKGKSIEENRFFNEGLFTVQDESAMLVGQCMDLKENSIVLDLCSAPGGKATHASEIMNNTGKVLAFDIYDHKLELINNNAKRLGINNLTTEILDATKLDKNLINLADAVITDVPCSGLGIIRKKPEIKWNKSKEEFREIIDIQKSILSNAAHYVKKGGYIIYSTCTLNVEENEKNVEWFLNKFKNFTSEKIYFGKLDNFIYHNNGYVTILPDKYMDGFFIAKLKKVSDW